MADDSLLLAERCGQLQAETVDLKAQLKDCERKLSNQGYFRYGYYAGIAWCLSIPLLLLGWMAIKGLNATGVVEGCYIVPHGDEVVLLSRIDWAADRAIGRFESFDNAILAAQKIKCALDTSGARP